MEKELLEKSGKFVSSEKWDHENGISTSHWTDA